MNYTEVLTKAEAERNYLTEHLETIQIEKTKLISQSDNILKAQVFFQTVAKQTQEKLQIHIEDITQAALDACFPDKYDFTVEFEIKRGKTEANLFLENGSGDAVDPMDSTGGGLIDIISYALRLAAWSLSHNDNVLLLDECFKFLSENLLPFAAELMKELTIKLKIQLILVTHRKEFVEIADKIFEVDQTKGKSFIKQA